MRESEPHPSDRPHGLLNAWTRRFGYALRGIAVAFSAESNFWICGVLLAVTVAVGAWLDLSPERWCLVALATTTIVVAEMFNTAIENLAKSITRERRPEIRDALDIAAGAVLLSTIGAACVGVIAIVWPLVARLS
jgi:diacylglycerol kinase